MHAGWRVLASAAWLCAAAPARAEDARAVFDRAVNAELHGGDGAATTAFALYRRAADLGLPDAAFNAAVMLDSGRGIGRNVAQAATWYARAAAHGHERSAYNLGQLYAEGDGVPANPDLARVWFEASHLPAARDRLNGLARATPDQTSPAAVMTAWPVQNARISSDMAGVELVWTASPDPEPLKFLIEVRSVGTSDAHEVFSCVTPVSSAFVLLPPKPATYAWRVTAIASQAARYWSAPWVTFDYGTGLRLTAD